jgi:diacylglycerol kinase (ATP)
MAKRLTVVLNPVAGRGTTLRRHEELERLLRDRFGEDWQIFRTVGRGDGVRLAKCALEQGSEIIAAAGGDGTVGEVLNGLVGSDAKLAVLPLGTGNDLSRAIGIGLDLEKSIAAIAEGSPKAIDVGRCGDRWFVNVAGCGFDAAVAKRVNAGFKAFKGRSAYVAAVLTTLATYKPYSLRIKVDGQEIDQDVMLCAIANANCYGGGMQVAPEADMQDGLFDVVVVGALSKLEFMRQFPKVFKGKHLGHPKVVVHRARTVEIESDDPLPILIDGDLFGTTPACITMEKAGVQIMHPKT